jgi:TPR repeat protein
MKLLIPTFFTLLLLGFAGSSYGQDFEETKLLAEQGIADAQYNLGVMYDYGNGVPENAVRAYVWLSVAAAEGDKSAKEAIDSVRKVLTFRPGELARGQEIATKCFESDYQDCE